MQPQNENMMSNAGVFCTDFTATELNHQLSSSSSVAMAGNIVPAIATTNAVIAGVIVMEALKVLAGDFKKCKTVCCNLFMLLL